MDALLRGAKRPRKPIRNTNNHRHRVCRQHSVRARLLPHQSAQTVVQLLSSRIGHQRHLFSPHHTRRMAEPVQHHRLPSVGILSDVYLHEWRLQFPVRLVRGGIYRRAIYCRSISIEKADHVLGATCQNRIDPDDAGRFHHEHTVARLVRECVQRPYKWNLLQRFFGLKGLLSILFRSHNLCECRLTDIIIIEHSHYGLLLLQNEMRSFNYFDLVSVFIVPLMAILVLNTFIGYTVWNGAGLRRQMTTHKRYVGRD